MAGFLGNAVSRHVSMGAVAVLTGSWVAARASSSANAKGRQWIKIQPKGRDTVRLAILYVNKNADGTFTAPTGSAHGAFIVPSSATLVEPISDDVTVYLRAAQNGGSSGGFPCIIAEFS